MKSKSNWMNENIHRNFLKLPLGYWKIWRKKKVFTSGLSEKKKTQRLFYWFNPNLNTLLFVTQ